MQAILTLVQAWVAAGRPRGQRLGSFEQWAEVIGGILQVVGVEGFLDNLEEYYAAADQEGQDWREFSAAWWEHWQAAPRTVGQLTEFCAALELMSMARGEGSPRSQQTRLGNALAQARDRVFGRLQLRRVERTHHRAGSSWQLTLLEGPAGDPATPSSTSEDAPDGTAEPAVLNAENQVPAPALRGDKRVDEGTAPGKRETSEDAVGDLAGQGIPPQAKQNQADGKHGTPWDTLLTPPRAPAGGCAPTPTQEVQHKVSQGIAAQSRPLIAHELGRDTHPKQGIPLVSQVYPNLDSRAMGITLDLADLPDDGNENVVHECEGRDPALPRVTMRQITQNGQRQDVYEL